MGGKIATAARIILLLWLAMASANAACPTAGTRAVVLKAAMDGDSFLAADGSEVELAGVLALGSGGEKIGAEAQAAARAELSRLLGAGALSLAFGPQEKDRYGRQLAQVFAGGDWVQGRLLREGLARAMPEWGEGACAAELLAEEDEGRRAKRGHWGDGSFAVLTPDELAQKTGTFQIVEGTVRAVAVQKRRAYINFGADWKSDFTVAIAPDDMKEFRRPKMNLKGLTGAQVRVRGWLESYYGPEIQIARPAAIEILSDTAPPKRKKKRPGH